MTAPRRTRVPWIVLGLLAGSVLGWIAAGLADDGRAPGARAPSVATESAGAPEPAPSAAQRRPPVPLPASREDRPRDETPDGRVAESVPGRRAPAEVAALLSDALLAFARDGIDGGWRRRRTDPLPDADLARGMQLFEEAVLSAPESIGAKLARDQDELDAAREHGPGFVLLAELEQRRGERVAHDVAADPVALAQLQTRRSSGPNLPGLDHLQTTAEELEDGTTLTFPPGAYSLRRFLDRARTVPRDVTLRGAGRDQTLLVFEDEISPRTPLIGLEIRSCTVLARRGALVDTGESSLTFDDVRFVGWNHELIDSDRLLLVARNCLFEGGYERSSGSESVLSVRDSLVARFENCVFSQLQIARSLRAGPNVGVVFAACVLRDLTRPLSAQEEETYVLANTTVDLLERGTETFVRHQLEDLFPDWRRQLVK